MTLRFKELLQNNQPLSLEDKTLLADKWLGTLDADDVFTRNEILPADIVEVLRKYGWFWLSIEKDAENNGGASDLVVVDLRNETEVAKAEIQYYNTRTGEMQVSNFTDFVQRVKQGNQAEALATAVMRLNKSMFEGADRVRLTGFPSKPYKKAELPVKASFHKLYKDFLYYSDKRSFAAYLHSYLEGIGSMTMEEKGAFFEKMIYFNFNTRQASLYVQENCVMSSKATMFKLMGLLPSVFQVLEFKENPRLPSGSARTTWVVDYPAELSEWLKEELDLEIYEFATIMGLTGALDMQRKAYQKMGLEVNTAAKRREIVLAYLNEKIIPFLAKHSANPLKSMRMQPYLIRGGKKEDIHEFIVKLSDPETIYPAAIQVIHSSRLPHFIAVVYNPFKNSLVVLDPLIIGLVEDGMLVEEYVSNIIITDENGLYGMEWPEGRYKPLSSRRCFLVE